MGWGIRLISNCLDILRGVHKPSLHTTHSGACPRRPKNGILYLMQKQHLYTGAFVAFIIFIIALANQGSEAFIFRLIRFVPFGDKLGHFFLVGTLACFINLSLNWRRIRLPFAHLLLGSLLVAGVMLLEEISQLWLTHRTFDLFDLTSDLLGIWLLPQALIRAGRGEFS